MIQDIFSKIECQELAPPRVKRLFALVIFATIAFLITHATREMVFGDERAYFSVNDQLCRSVSSTFRAVTRLRGRKLITNRRLILRIKQRLKRSMPRAQRKRTKKRVSQLRLGIRLCKMGPPTVTPDPSLPQDGEFSGNLASLTPYRDSLTEREVVHLCRKVAFGCSPDLINYGTTNGLNALVENLLTMTTPAHVERFALELAELPDGNWNQLSAFRYWTVLMAGGSPLQERFALFWHDHFATSLLSFASKRNYIQWHVGLLRAEALGSFEVLLNAMHSDPAMLEWLDNRHNHFNSATSTLHLNENYGREVLELFTMGVKDFYSGNQNYSEADMRALTRALTGWNLLYNQGAWTSRFESSRWDPSAKTLFASTHVEKTELFDYRSATHYLLYSHPATARAIAGKLLRVFIHPEAPELLTQQLAEVLITSRYDLRSAVSALLRSSAMFSLSSRKTCVMSPAEHIMTFLRSLGLKVTNEATVWALTEFMTNSGQELLNPPSVFGWMGCGVGERGTTRAYGEKWLSSQSLISRQRWLTELLHQLYWTDNGESLRELLPHPSASAEETLNHLSLRLDVELSPEEKSLILQTFLAQDVSSSGEVVARPWDTSDRRLLLSRIAGLLEILFLHPRGLLR